ncbi:putative holin [Pseudomethylobacillus aquaticus]|uniref:putative holin n=1 Tax=Pseudomethylobacillus aquaticus TaxID=2676064 RepID=UPI001961AE98
MPPAPHDRLAVGHAVADVPDRPGSPAATPISLYKLSLITMAAVIGYWIDRSAFP